MRNNKLTKRVAVAAIGTSMVFGGVTAIPQEKTLFDQRIGVDVKISQELKEELEVKGWNVKSDATVIDLTTKESWLIKSDDVQVNVKKRETVIRQKWSQFLDSDGEWKDIKSEWIETPQGFTATNAPFQVLAPLTSSGTLIFNNNNRWDVLDNEVITDKPLVTGIEASGVNDVRGRIEKGDLIAHGALHEDAMYVVYENAYDGADLIYYIDDGTAPRLAKYIRFNSKPTSDQFGFIYTFSEDMEFITEDGEIWDKQSRLVLPKSESLIVGRSGSDVRGMGLKPIRIWDSDWSHATDPDIERNITEVDLVVNSFGPNRYVYTKRLDLGFFDAAVFPVYTDTTSTFYPDPHTESTSVDGVASYAGSALPWMGVHGHAGNDHSDAFSPRDVGKINGAGVANQFTQLRRGIYLFDTASLPDDDTIDSATFQFTCTSVTDDESDDIALVNSTPASNTDIVNGDYAELGTTEQGTAIAYADLTCNGTTYNSITLNATGEGNIEVTGVTKFGLRSEYDRSDTAPTWSSGTIQNIVGNFAEESGTSKDPKLVVEHSSASKRIIITSVDDVKFIPPTYYVGID